MIVILNINTEKFSLNGIPYFKNFMPHVVAGQLKIVNAYDSKFELTALDSVLNYSVDDVIYTSASELQDALLPVLYTRNSLNFYSDLPFYNTITKETGLSSLGINKTFNASWEWLINNGEYSNPASVTVPFPLASPGKSRLDRVVVNKLNTFVRVAGVESDSSPTAEPRPNNTVDATFVLVTDSEVGEPTPPVVGDNFVHRTGNENVKGIKTFDNEIRMKSEASDSYLSFLEDRVRFLTNQSGIDNGSLSLTYTSSDGDYVQEFQPKDGFIALLEDVQDLADNVYTKTEVDTEDTNTLNSAKSYADELFPSFYEIGKLLIFKRNSNEDKIIEINDLAMGMVEGAFITGIYLGGDILLSNFNIINQIDF